MGQTILQIQGQFCAQFNSVILFHFMLPVFDTSHMVSGHPDLNEADINGVMVISGVQPD